MSGCLFFCFFLEVNFFLECQEEYTSWDEYQHNTEGVKLFEKEIEGLLFMLCCDVQFLFIVVDSISRLFTPDVAYRRPSSCYS